MGALGTDNISKTIIQYAGRSSKFKAESKLVALTEPRQNTRVGNLMNTGQSQFWWDVLGPYQAHLLENKLVLLIKSSAESVLHPKLKASNCILNP